ncbi:MAG: protein kinase, partial [Chloroflexaceae bacterium]|nr:protein kinase [Chloroflexaceae bacterium]
MTGIGIPETLIQGRYRIVRQIGQGGMGAVYEAIDERLAQPVALKQTLLEGESFGKAFEREAKILARMRHPALVRVIDHFVDDHGQFLVMDFVPGEDLGKRLQQRDAPFPVDTVLDWADQVLDALEYLHGQHPPIIHRDIKPQNLKLTEAGQVVLLDFGLAKGTAALQSRTTSTGSIFGYTPQYAPLEQVQGTGTTPRSDLYALGATVYHLLTATPPENALNRTTAVMDDRPDPLRPAHEANPQVPPAVSEVVQQAMSLQPGKRPASAAEMRAALKTAQSATVTAARIGYLPQENQGYTVTTVSPRGQEEQEKPEGAQPGVETEAEEAPEPVLRRLPGGPGLRRMGIRFLVLVALLLVVARAATNCGRDERPTAVETPTRADVAAEHPSLVVAGTPDGLPPPAPIATAAGDVGDGSAFFPAMAGTPVTRPPAAINPASATQVVPLAQWEERGHVVNPDLPPAVLSVAFAPDGQTLVTGLGDTTIQVWQVRDGTLLRTLDQHQGGVGSVAFSPDGQTFVSGGYDQTVRVWQASDGALLHTLEGHTDWVLSVAFSPDGQTIASGSSDETVRLWRAGDGTLIRTLEGQSNSINGLTFSPDGQTLAAATEDNRVLLWQVRDGTVLHRLEGMSVGVLSVAFSPDGTLLASGSRDSAVRLWQVSDGQLLHTLKGDVGQVFSVAFSPDGTVLASGGSYRAPRLWQVRDGALLHTLEGHTDEVYGVAFSPDGLTLASGSGDQTVRLWGVGSGAPVASPVAVPGTPAPAP